MVASDDLLRLGGVMSYIPLVAYDSNTVGMDLLQELMDSRRIVEKELRFPACLDEGYLRSFVVPVNPVTW